jgi:bifunctional non-homologous end joining protein LigD
MSPQAKPRSAARKKSATAKKYVAVKKKVVAKKTPAVKKPTAGKVSIAKARSRRRPSPKSAPEKAAVQHEKVAASAKQARVLTIPTGSRDLELDFGGRVVRLTNLDKLFWPELGITKRDLLQYYSHVAPFLIPHLVGRAMVMKRYPNGAAGEFFFMKRAPSPRPDWIKTCRILHASGNIIDFPIIDDLPSLLWVINLGCIDLNPWYARCDDYDRPDFLHFDLDPVPNATFDQVIETALLVRRGIEGLGMPCYAKTTGSKGIHVYIPIQRGPLQKVVWEFAKSFALGLAAHAPKLVTAEYRIAKRPPNHVLVDYNQNAWGRTLASVYSVRPKPRATVSTPITWEELEQGVALDSFRIDTVPERLERLGDLWKPLLAQKGRVNLEKIR